MRRSLLYTSLILIFSTLIFVYWWDSRWRYIMIHHSAGDYGTIEHLQKVHRERQGKDPIDLIPYHYIIGNGNGMEMGEVAQDNRGKLDLWGMHVSANNFDRNFRGIGICLIGNYEKKQVSQKQYEALVKLTKELMQRYDIPVENVTGHGYLKGESTKCPGKHFPMQKFLKDISR